MNDNLSKMDLLKRTFRENMINIKYAWGGSEMNRDKRQITKLSYLILSKYPKYNTYDDVNNIISIIFNDENSQLASEIVQVIKEILDENMHVMACERLFLILLHSCQINEDQTRMNEFKVLARALGQDLKIRTGLNFNRVDNLCSKIPNSLFEIPVWMIDEISGNFISMIDDISSYDLLDDMLKILRSQFSSIKLLTK